MIQFALLLGTLIALSTELLSTIGQLNRTGIVITWALLVIAGLVAGFFYLREAKRHADVNKNIYEIWEILALTGAAVYAILLLVTALAAPPNTNDSLQYHLSRVAHWAQNGSIAHYATTIERQVWMPPLAEYAVLQLYLLAGGDRLANLVQWGAMLACLGGVVQISRLLKLSWSGQVLALVFAVTLRMGVLQASSTQTDYVAALWLVCLAYAAVRLGLQPQGSTKLDLPVWGMAGLAVGLGALTKGSFYPFAAPFLVWMAVTEARRIALVTSFAREGGITRFASAGVKVIMRLTVCAAIGLAAVLLLNTGAWSRNLHTYGSPFGPAADTGALTNQAYGPGVLFSNTLRNLTLHIGTPYGEVNGLILRLVTGVHSLLGLDVNDPKTTFDPYRIKRSLHEDFAGNPYHLLALAIGLLWLWWSQRAVKRAGQEGKQGQFDQQIVVFLLAWLAGFLLFSWVFKWQSTGSRLQLPWFVLAAPVAGWAWQVHHPRPYAGMVVAAVLLLSSQSMLLTNLSRPLLPRGEEQLSLFNRPRLDWLFANAPEFEEGYKGLTRAVLETDCRQLGLLIDSSAPEYPLWVLLGLRPGDGSRLEHLTAGPALRQYLDLSFHPCAVLCVSCNETDVPPGYFLMSQHAGGTALYYRK